ncbi:MAG: hypothetical protein FD147_534 [Chloroflexi bacterium]|nr:MAG: hypothetical protein FD147_534 [Chloroflexota bacterium]
MIKPLMSNEKRILIPLGAGTLGALFLFAVYFGIVSWAESPKHAIEFFWQDRWIVIPIILGFGVQVALYVILKLRLFLQAGYISPDLPLPATASIGTSSATSTIAMVACCVHHVTDVLPILGLTAAATFLAKYRQLFMVVGLGTTFLGIGYMLFILIRERRKAMSFNPVPLFTKEIT